MSENKIASDIPKEKTSHNKAQPAQHSPSYYRVAATGHALNRKAQNVLDQHQ